MNWYKKAKAADYLLGITSPDGNSASSYYSELKAAFTSTIRDISYGDLGHEELGDYNPEAKKILNGAPAVHWYFYPDQGLLKYWTKPSMFQAKMISEYLKKKLGLEIQRTYMF